MLTAVIHASADPTDLALTLAALVPAVAEGLMSHAVVVFDASDPAAERIADAMGASIVVAQGAPWTHGAAAARGEWVLLLRAGEEPEQGWIGAVERHLMAHAVSRRRPALLPAKGLMAGLRERLVHGFGRAGVRPGLIAPRAGVASGAAMAAPLRLAVGRFVPRA